MRYLYLHGFASGPLSRKAQFFHDKLAAVGVSLEVPALDQGDFEHLTITGQLDYMTRLLGGEPAVLMGSSMGGYLAALYASGHPEIERMVLLAPAFGFGARWAETFGAENVAAWKARGMRRLASDLLDDSLAHPGYPRCRQPALVFHGVQDTVVPITAAQQWCAENPQARLVAMESGHELLDVLEAIWEQSREFLRDPGSD
jgi:pimeloyl-ACP methyl ester carboxylesterase